LRHKKIEKTFHYSELQAYFGQIHKAESSARDSPVAETKLEIEMFEARHKQHGVVVNGQKYKSVAAAFAALNLPMHKHQSFRKKLKVDRKAEFDGIVFEIA